MNIRTATPRDRRIVAAVVIVALATYAITAWLIGVGPVDDTYIFLRYAENLAAGHGPVFNPGERVEGYTSPLWVALLGAVAALSDSDLVALAVGLSALFGAATIVAVSAFSVRTLSPERRVLAFVPALLLASNPSFVFWTWTGMGTALFAFLFFTTFAGFVRQVEGSGMMWAAGLVLTLAALARLEIIGLLVVYVPFVAYVHRAEARVALRKAASFVAPLLLLALHFAWRYAYYGAWLPNTYYAKADAPLPALLDSGLRYGARFALAYLWLVLAAVACAAIYATGRYRMGTGWRLATVVAVVWPGYVTWVGGDHFPLFRFYVPILSLLALLVLYLVDGLPVQRLRRAAPATVAACLVVLQGALNYAVLARYGGEAHQNVELAAAWSEVGRWLGDNLPPDATIACNVVGAIPYRSKLVTYDLLGLTDAQVARSGNLYSEGRPGHQRYDTDYILTRRPDYIVYHSSGRFTEPRNADPATIPKPYAYALFDLANDPRTAALYEYRAVRMDNGRVIELLQRRD